MIFASGAWLSEWRHLEHAITRLKNVSVGIKQLFPKRTKSISSPHGTFSKIFSWRPHWRINQEWRVMGMVYRVLKLKVDVRFPCLLETQKSWNFIKFQGLQNSRKSFWSLNVLEITWCDPVKYWNNGLFQIWQRYVVLAVHRAAGYQR